MSNKFLLILILLISLHTVYAVPTSFIDIDVDESLDKFFVRTITFGPESEPEDCNTKDNLKMNCSKFLYYKSPIWADVETSDLFLHTQRWYVLTHPDTKAEYRDDCRKLAGAFSVNAPITLSKVDGKLKMQPNKPDDLTLSFSLYNNYSYPCIYMEFPYLNPYLIKKNQKFYPFDNYFLDLGFYIPKISLVNFEVKLPLDFKLSNIETIPETKTVTSDSYSNPIFFEFKDLNVDEDNPVGAKIKFERFPSFSDKIFPLIMLLLLPLAAFLYFGFSPNIKADGRRMNATTAFYLSLFPLFFAFGGYFSNFPNVYSFAHASFTFTVFLLIVSLIKDFTKYEFQRGLHRFLIILVSLIISIIPLFF